MNAKRYEKAVDKINAAMDKIKDEDVQRVWNTVADMWADWEGSVMEALGIKNDEDEEDVGPH